jgi:flavin-dependent dehydrogenase
MAPPLAHPARMGQTERHLLRGGTKDMRIVVVGSGPAGASAGYHLASSGHEVTLLDRARFPRDKTCGDWVTPGAVRALSSMGLSPGQLQALACEHTVVDASLLASPNGARSRVAAQTESYGIPRVVFDDVLRRQALGAGCEFVQREVRDRDVASLWNDYDRVIDARGATAGLTNSGGLRAYWTLRRSDCERPSTVQMFADRSYRLGYGWVFPVAAGGETVRFNVGVGAAKTECAAAGRSLPAFFDSFVRQNDMVRRMSERALEKTKPIGYPVALATPGRLRVRDGILKIGDAANLTDPLTGEGIGSAIVSGMLVAGVIDTTRDVADAERAWQRVYDDIFAPDFRVALRLRRLLTTTPAKNTALWILGRTPSLARRFHEALSGTLRYRDLLSLG